MRKMNCNDDDDDADGGGGGVHQSLVHFSRTFFTINSMYILHQLLPDRTQPTHNLRSRKHDCSLTAKHSVTANEFITRMLYKYIY